LSKIDDYLADNLCVPMLSEVMHWVQEESGRAARWFPNWESTEEGERRLLVISEEELSRS
jgi:hypothetical protein